MLNISNIIIYDKSEGMASAIMDCGELFNLNGAHNGNSTS